MKQPLSCSSSTLMAVAAAVVGYDLFEGKHFTTRRDAMRWAEGVSSKDRCSKFGRVYMIVTDGVVKIGSSNSLAHRFEAHLGFNSSPLAYYRFRYLTVSPLSSDFRRLERQVLRLCQSVGVPRFGPIGRPLGYEYFNAGHPLFEKLSLFLQDEISWSHLLDLCTGRSHESQQWRVEVQTSLHSWFSFRKRIPLAGKKFDERFETESQSTINDIGQLACPVGT